MKDIKTIINERRRLVINTPLSEQPKFYVQLKNVKDKNGKPLTIMISTEHSYNEDILKEWIDSEMDNLFINK